MSTADEAVKAASSTGLQRLLKRGLPKHVHHLRAASPEETAASLEAVREAKEHLELASIRMDGGADAARQAAEAELVAAREQLASCYEPVTIRALKPTEYEALAAKYKDENDAAGIDQDSLGRAAFLAGVEGDLTEEDWLTVLDQCSQGERGTLFIAALVLNARTTDGSIPKG